MSVVIGIDIGGSTTKIVGIRSEGGERVLIKPQNVKATDPLTAVYGAFGKFTDENRLEIKDVSAVMMTGVGSSYVKRDLYGLDCRRASEFESIGKGGLYLSGLREALVVSMGTGTAMVHAKDGEMRYLGGTGVGGGTLMGLSKLLLKAENIDHIAEYADGGDLANVDLRIKDITAKGTNSGLAGDVTAANFGNVSDVATKSDIAKGILNMVFETVAMVSVFAARSVGVKDVVITGNVTVLDMCRKKFEEISKMGYGVNFVIPEHSRYATVIGAALLGAEERGL